MCDYVRFLKIQSHMDKAKHIASVCMLNYYIYIYLLYTDVANSNWFIALIIFHTRNRFQSHKLFIDTLSFYFIYLLIYLGFTAQVLKVWCPIAY